MQNVTVNTIKIAIQNCFCLLWIHLYPSNGEKMEENQGKRQTPRKKGAKRERKINRANSKRKLIADAFSSLAY